MRLPGAFANTRDFSLARQLTEANSTHIKIPDIAVISAASPASTHDTRGILGDTF